MDWENLKYFLAVANTGSLAGAGRFLGVKHTTVMRRVADLEAGLGSKLFERYPTGYQLTQAGNELFDAARPLEEELAAVGRKLSGLDQRLTGIVRVASLELLSPLICTALAKMRRANPGLQTELLVSPNAVNIARHEADVAVRVTTSPPEYLVGRRIGTLSHGIYAAVGHPACNAQRDELTSYDWLTYTGARRELGQAQWVRSNVSEDRIVFRTDHTATLFWATRAGLGLAVLPRYAADPDPALQCLATVPSFGQELWLLTHQDLRRTLRIRTLMDCIGEELLTHRQLIEGTPLP